MKPLRDNLKRFLIPQGCDFQRKNPRVPVVTYIDRWEKESRLLPQYGFGKLIGSGLFYRQSTTRKLVEEDHQALMTEMQSLHDQGKIEFYDAIMEDIPRHDQVRRSCNDSEIPSTSGPLLIPSGFCSKISVLYGSAN